MAGKDPEGSEARKHAERLQFEKDRIRDIDLITDKDLLWKIAMDMDIQGHEHALKRFYSLPSKKPRILNLLERLFGC